MMSQPTALYVDAGLQASKYVNVGMFAVLIFDYFITLEVEVRFEHNTILVKVRRRLVNNEDLCFLEHLWTADPGDCLFLGGRNNVFEFRKYNNAVGQLQRTFFNDSAKYMMCIMTRVLTSYYEVVSSFSIVLTIVPPITWVSITDSPQVVIHSVLASRILFNLRASEGRSQTHTTLSDVSEIQFGGGQLSTADPYLYLAKTRIRSKDTSGKHNLLQSAL
ncbi:uncharacterized protein EDB93DRAFT_1297823 [Suillus bovinus]|uniref:uncharacterized protein n=1 Tax=Suillus bovinus TaxID=48563 RepID=UPI001B85E64D|nr:uncharacterized protein EDB93DRAFT_1297823 [Suillus bovinus]KAG2140268.1 hypothetical protein EDB93DRAFT_1297823 [Suillus bovinus]